MMLVSAVAALFFWGGWLSPFQGIPGLEHALPGSLALSGYLLKWLFLYFYIFG